MLSGKSILKLVNDRFFSLDWYRNRLKPIVEEDLQQHYKLLALDALSFYIHMRYMTILTRLQYAIGELATKFLPTALSSKDFFKRLIISLTSLLMDLSQHMIILAT